MILRFFSESDSKLVVILTKDLNYNSDRVVVKSGGIEYGFSMGDSYDSFYVDAKVKGVCTTFNFEETFEHHSKKLAKAEIIEED